MTRKRRKAIHRKETGWGVHEVVEGKRQNAGRFIAQSSGWGGAKGYFKVFDAVEDAIAYVDWETRPLNKSKRIKF